MPPLVQMLCRCSVIKVDRASLPYSLPFIPIHSDPIGRYMHIAFWSLFCRFAVETSPGPDIGSIGACRAELGYWFDGGHASNAVA